MAATTAEAQVQKRCYRNQTAGWIGVVKLDHLGAQQGAPVAPYGTVYLSDDEAILTSRAPADPKDNPFVEQPFMFQDADGKRVEQNMAPLVLVAGDAGEDQSERFVPINADPVVVAAEQARTEATLAAHTEQPRAVPDAPVEPTLVPASGAAVSPHLAQVTTGGEPEPPAQESWVENPDRTEEPQSGSLGGSDGEAGKAAEGDPLGLTPVDGAPSSQAPVQQTVGAQAEELASTEEETAGHTDAGEETGAADRPVGEAPEGEFASHEEVGSPDAATQDGGA